MSETATIPTITDVLFAVNDQFAEEAAAGTMSDQMATDLGQVYAGNDYSDVGLLNLLIYARGCHEAAAIHRKAGNEDQAGFLHAMGQDLIAKAVQTFGELLVVGVEAGGLAKH